MAKYIFVKLTGSKLLEIYLIQTVENQQNICKVQNCNRIACKAKLLIGKCFRREIRTRIYLNYSVKLDFSVTRKMTNSDDQLEITHS